MPDKLVEATRRRMDLILLGSSEHWQRGKGTQMKLRERATE